MENLRAGVAFQNTKFELAACATDVEAGQSLSDRALMAHEAGELTAADAAMVKLFCTELQGRVIDRCLQLHGGYNGETIRLDGALRMAPRGQLALAVAAASAMRAFPDTRLCASSVAKCYDRCRVLQK